MRPLSVPVLQQALSRLVQMRWSCILEGRKVKEQASLLGLLSHAFCLL